MRAFFYSLGFIDDLDALIAGKPGSHIDGVHQQQLGQLWELACLR